MTPHPACPDMGLDLIVSLRPPATISVNYAARLRPGFPVWSFRFCAACRHERGVSYAFHWTRSLVQPPGPRVSGQTLAGAALSLYRPAFGPRPVRRVASRRTGGMASVPRAALAETAREPRPKPKRIEWIKNARCLTGSLYWLHHCMEVCLWSQTNPPRPFIPSSIRQPTCNLPLPLNPAEISFSP